MLPVETEMKTILKPSKTFLTYIKSIFIFVFAKTLQISAKFLHKLVEKDKLFLVN